MRNIIVYIMYCFFKLIIYNTYFMLINVNRGPATLKIYIIIFFNIGHSLMILQLKFEIFRKNMNLNNMLLYASLYTIVTHRSL